MVYQRLRRETLEAQINAPMRKQKGLGGGSVDLRCSRMVVREIVLLDVRTESGWMRFAERLGSMTNPQSCCDD